MTVPELADKQTTNGLDHPKSNGVRSNSWQQPGTSAADFRSDTVTTPTHAMLQSVQNVLLDDAWNEGGMTAFERHLAQITGREAALFALSGVMGNQLAFRSHLTRHPMAVLCDKRSHALLFEAGGIASLTGALVQSVMPRNGLYLTLEDIKENVVLEERGDVFHCPTRLIHLENPLGGVTMPLDEVRRICQFARQHGIKVHIDGARLWESVAAGHCTLPEICAEADSVTMCFTKGLGAPVGSILVGSDDFIVHSKWIMKSIGGHVRQPGIVTCMAWAALDEAFGRDPNGSEAVLLRKSHENARRIAEVWEELGGQLVLPAQTNHVWVDLSAAGISPQEWVKQGEEWGLRLRGPRMIVHYQITDEALDRMTGFLRHILSDSRRHANGRIKNSQDFRNMYSSY